MKILFIGESWHIHMIHSKGFDSFTSSKYEQGADWLLKCLQEKGVTVDYMPAHQVPVNFPDSLSGLTQFAAIVISDIGSNSFLLHNQTFYHSQPRPDALGLIRDYVAQGGGLLMIGGYLSFMGIQGKANYKNTVLAEVLPVIMQDTDDRVELPQGVAASVVSPPHATVAEFDQWPPFLGYNKVTAKPGSQTILTIAADPLLVYGTYQAGRTACFMSDCSPHWGSHQFLHWQHYATMWFRIVNYIAQNTPQA